MIESVLIWSIVDAVVVDAVSVLVDEAVVVLPRVVEELDNVGTVEDDTVVDVWVEELATDVTGVVGLVENEVVWAVDVWVEELAVDVDGVEDETEVWAVDVWVEELAVDVDV